MVGNNHKPTLSYAILDSVVLAFHPRLDYAGVRKNEHPRGADEPEESAEGGGPPEEGQANDEQSRVEGLLGHDLITHLHRLWCCAVKQGQNKCYIFGSRGGRRGGSNRMVVGGERTK